MGQQAHENDGVPPEVTSEEPREPREAIGGDGSACPPTGLTPSEAVRRPGPSVPLRLLLLFTVVNLLLALALFAGRPPWRVERTAAPPMLPAQVARLSAQVEWGEHGAAYALALTDDDLTETAGYFLGQSESVPFTQVRVAVVGGHLEASGVTTSLAVGIPVRILADVEARDGAPVVRVTDVGIGGLPLPAFARAQVLDEANRAVDLSRYSLPVTVDSIELRAGLLEARGKVK